MLDQYIHRKLFKSGFTLIELIVVVAILAFLATLAIPRVTKVISKARNKTYEANITIIKNALERYYVDYEKYPDKIEDLVPDYLQEIPDKLDDKSTGDASEVQDKSYEYSPFDDNQSYSLDGKKYGLRSGDS